MNTEWIDNLKSGDEVIVDGGGALTHPHVAVVDKITPAGFIKVGSTLYKQDGFERGTGWFLGYISEATPEAVKQLLEAKTVYKAQSMMKNTNTITYEQAVKILAVLESNEWNKNTPRQFTDEEAQDLFGKENTEDKA